MFLLAGQNRAGGESIGRYAGIRTMPATTFWPGELTPMKLRP